MLAIVWVIVVTAAMTLAAVLYNLISDVVGGVEVVVLEEYADVSTPQTSRSGRACSGYQRRSRKWWATNGASAGLTSEDTVETGTPQTL